MVAFRHTVYWPYDGQQKTFKSGFLSKIYDDPKHLDNTGRYTNRERDIWVRTARRDCPWTALGFRRIIELRLIEIDVQYDNLVLEDW